tara:strand:- start:135 stop:362 length:228 start_codon:yes stop_codon:yes gene_type:complete
MGPRDGENKHKRPWVFTPGRAAPIMLAGIWDGYDTIDEGRVASFMVVTQPADAPLNGYHRAVEIVIKVCTPLVRY